MSNQIGFGVLYGYPTAGFSVPAKYSAATVIPSIRLGMAGGEDEIPGQDGNIQGINFMGDYIEATFEVIPKGATKAAALAAAGAPERGTSFTAVGFPNVPFGAFTTNALNGANWILWNATMNGSTTEKFSMEFTMRRYPGITATTFVLDS